MWQEKKEPWQLRRKSKKELLVRRGFFVGWGCWECWLVVLFFCGGGGVFCVLGWWLLCVATFTSLPGQKEQRSG